MLNIGYMILPETIDVIYETCVRKKVGEQNGRQQPILYPNHISIYKHQTYSMWYTRTNVHLASIIIERVKYGFGSLFGVHIHHLSDEFFSDLRNWTLGKFWGSDFRWVLSKNVGKTR